MTWMPTDLIQVIARADFHPGADMLVQELQQRPLDPKLWVHCQKDTNKAGFSFPEMLRLQSHGFCRAGGEEKQLGQCLENCWQGGSGSGCCGYRATAFWWESRVGLWCVLGPHRWHAEFQPEEANNLFLCLWKEIWNILARQLSDPTCSQWWIQSGAKWKTWPQW